ncbi:hydrogenase maturation nickel metallochaperone HypA [Desulfovibrio sp. ZJ200]|uniref:hydrogenase maturation nickel metallochaperone HypA/HybF n=1 Tax=Desulfovibrio sp. ZJ200 TaxID=2709792 RepID=UPI001F14EC4B|nr:hydrogenase maturation nickel metallochaperone HypA [Desulfovibrio sp. ZJ200]
MTIAQSLLRMAEEEIAAKNCSRLEVVRVEYGAIAGVVPESLELCFEALIKGTPHERARLELVRLPLRLRCPFCGEIFGGEGQEALLQPCPGCGEQFGHVVEQGKELILSHLEAR